LDNAGDRTILNPGGVGITGSDVSPVCNTATFVALQTADPTITACGDAGSEAAVVAYQAINPSARYLRTGIGALATAGKSTIASPPINNFDLGVSKGIKFTERVEFRFGVLAVNVLNHPQYTTGLVSQANSISATSSGQRNVLIPRGSTVGAQWIGSDYFPNGVFGNFKSAYGSNARQLTLHAHLSF
jgi:hypothetical protein